MSLLEQRGNIKFCVLLEKSPSETLEMLRKAYGNSAMKKSAVYEWHKRFLGGRTTIEDNVRTGRPSTSTTDDNIERVRKLVRADRRTNIDTIASELGISLGSVHSILHNDLNMHRVCLHMVPKMLSPEQKEMRVTMSRDLIGMADADDSFLRKIITGDETWCFLYDSQTKRQSAE
ncbi:protein GVQW3-like [Uloborus diversus]|uniref:protein GVQW3-like n=1 Tax=Uloborus diversus TaxID=327109 RepID=UPI0024097194|nr:protein GVQW3-like [Uloborus diversus]